MKLHEFSAETAAWLDPFLLARLRGTPRELYRAAAHLIAHGGKRLRPHLVVQCCRLAGGTVRQARSAAAAVELIHNFTLIHDDIMDHAAVRHGVPAVHARFGTATGILAGDLLFARAFDLLAAPRAGGGDPRPQIARLLQACRELCEGQMLDIAMSRAAALPSARQYLAMTGKKTAALFAASCALGAMCAGADRRTTDRLAAFGRNLGMAFQLMDDLADVAAGRRGAPRDPGNDLREGKKTLPILLALRRADGRARREIRAVLGNPAATDAAVRRAAALIAAAGVEREVRRKAVAYARAARTALARFDGPIRAGFEALLDGVVAPRARRLPGTTVAQGAGR